MKKYVKSYKGFVIMLLIFNAMLISLAFIDTNDVNLVTILINNVMTLWMAVLTGIIYINENVYWYTGVTFEEAERAGTEKRKKYALRHFVRFVIYAAVYLIYSLIAIFLKIPFGISIAINLVGIVGIAISTVSIKLE